jgi:hypothetical protein
MVVPIVEIPAGKYTCDKLMQPLNALLLIIVTLYGRTIEVKFVQLLNAETPIDHTVSEIFI